MSWAKRDRRASHEAHLLMREQAKLESQENAAHWPALSEHTWMLAHKSIAADLEDTSIVLERLSAAEYIEDWEILAIKKWWRRVTENVVLHHRQEEDLVFPKLKERIDFPPKVSADHKELLKLMAHAATTFEGLGSSTGADECLAVVDEIEQLMLPHMHEEEVTVLPGMMQKFLPAEIVKIEREMGKEFDWFDMPHFYRPFGTDIEKKRQHANRSFGKPGFVFDYFIAKDFERYDVEFGSLIDELKDPGRKEFNEEQRSMYYARRRQSAMCVPGHATVNPAHQEH